MMLDTSYVIDLLREQHERRVGNATALQHAEPLVTNDTDHFSRVEDLVVLGY
jgi:hypothetical protein